MSITCSCLLLLFLVCLSLHACNARRLAGTLDKKPEEKFHQFSSENHEDHNNVMKSSSSMETEDKTQYNLEDMSKTSLERSKDEEKVKGSDAVRTLTKKSVVSSVSWRVPQKKRVEKQPGFNLDYSPPKTHPPSHN